MARQGQKRKGKGISDHRLQGSGEANDEEEEEFMPLRSGMSSGNQVTPLVDKLEGGEMSSQEATRIRTRHGIEVQGTDVPAPVLTFHELGLPTSVLHQLSAQGCQDPTPVQMQVLGCALQGRDLIALAETGSGKTLAYLLPLLLLLTRHPPALPGQGPVALIVVPTRELVEQIYGQLAVFLPQQPGADTTPTIHGSTVGMPGGSAVAVNVPDGTHAASLLSGNTSSWQAQHVQATAAPPPLPPVLLVPPSSAYPSTAAYVPPPLSNPGKAPSPPLPPPPYTHDAFTPALPARYAHANPGQQQQQQQQQQWRQPLPASHYAHASSPYHAMPPPVGQAAQQLAYPSLPPSAAAAAAAASAAGSAASASPIYPGAPPGAFMSPLLPQPPPPPPLGPSFIPHLAAPGMHLAAAQLSAQQNAAPTAAEYVQSGCQVAAGEPPSRSHRALGIVGGVPIASQIPTLLGGVDVLVATPGRLLDLLERRAVRLDRCRYLVLDEADRMLGEGMEDQLRQVVRAVPEGGRQTLLFSATLALAVERLAHSSVADPVLVSVGAHGDAAEAVEHEVLFTHSHAKRARLLQVYVTCSSSGRGQPQALSTRSGRGAPVSVRCGLAHATFHQVLRSTERPPVLVFCNSSEAVDALVKILRSEQFHVAGLHAAKGQPFRFRCIRALKEARLDVMVATDVASRGLDVADVARVVNYDMPDSIESYIHRCGRTGRMGKRGTATSLLTYECRIARELQQLLHRCRQEVPRELQDDVHLFGGMVIMTDLGDIVKR